MAATLENKVPHASYIKGALETSFTESVRRNSADLIGFATELFNDMYLADNPAKTRIEVNYDKYNKTALKKMAKGRGLRVKNA